MKKLFYQPVFWFVIVLIIATFFRVYNLASVPPGLYPDEAMNGNNALEVLHTGTFKIFYPENFGREGLFINIQALAISLFGNEPGVLRGVSALFGVLTVAGVYALTRRLTRGTGGREFIALASAFFIATGFWHINFSRIGFRAIMAPMFLVLALYFLIASLDVIRKKSQITNTKSQVNSNNQNPINKSWNLGIGYWLFAALGGVLFGLGMHSYIAYRAIPLLIVFIVVLYGVLFTVSWKKLILSFVIFVVFSLAAFAPLGMYFIKNPGSFFGRTSEVSVFSSDTPLRDLALNTGKTLLMFNVRGDANWRHNLSGESQLYWLVGLLLVVGVLYGAIGSFTRRISREETFFFWMCIVWVGVGLLPVVTSNEGIPHALRAILVIPPIFMLAGLGAFKTVQLLRAKLPARTVNAFIFVVGALLIGISYSTYFLMWGRSVQTANAFSFRYVAIGRQLNEIGPAVPKYVVANGGGIPERGIPVSAQTIMFITDTFREEQQKEKNLFYVTDLNDLRLEEPEALVIYMEPIQR